MKKLTEGEKSSKQSMISRLCEVQLLYDVCWDKLNQVLEQEIKKRGSDMKTYLPASYKNKLKK